MGDVLRMYVTGKQRERMLAGGLLDDNEIINIVDKVIKSIPDHEEVILDGFPRTIPQAEWLLEQVKTGSFKLDLAFHLVATHEAVKERLLKRARIDDKENAIEARFEEYERSTRPLIDWLTKRGVKVVEVDADRSVDAVNNDLVKYIKTDEA
jgi:adenylate kinase